MVVIKLLHLAGPSGDTAREIAYSDIGTRFGVSRTQVRNLLEDAEAKDLVRLNRGRTLTAQPTPALLEAFDRLIVDTMVAHDLSFHLAAGTVPEALAKSMQNIPLPDGSQRT